MNSPPVQSSLEGAWVEIMKAGDYGERGRWSPDDLDRLAAGYDPRLQPAPVVLGHPADDAPAFGWIKRLRRAGQSLWAQLEKVDPALEALLRAGRFRQRSVSLYRRFSATGGPYLRHLGFLGAAAPAVKGLAPVRFADAATLEFVDDFQASPLFVAPSESERPAFQEADSSPSARNDNAANPARQLRESEDLMSQKSTLDKPVLRTARGGLEGFLDHLRAFFTTGESAPSSLSPAAPAAGPADFAERIAQLEQRLDTLAAEKNAAEEKLTHTESERRRQQVVHFVESLRRRGRFPPAFDRWGVPEFMERLAALDSSVSFASLAQETKEAQEAEEKREDASPLAWFQDFLAKLPAVVEFAELAAGTAHPSPATGHRSPVVRFTEPQRGMTIDPASIELAERAEALAAAHGIPYAEALAQLRQEHRATPTTA